MKRILILLTLFSSHAFADICTQADTDITASYKEMKKTSINSENYDYDKLFSLEQRFTEKLTTYLTQQGSFECTYPQATATGLVIKNAADNQLRAFLWESILYIKEDKDTPHTFRYVLQFLGKNGKPQADASFIDVVAKPLDIYPIRLNNETIYGIAHEQLSKEEGTKHHSFLIRFLHINEENKLRPAMRLQNEGQYWLAYSYNPE
ncbi:MAG TPA: hypothetical protein DD638_09375, partial [Pasteurellaceae bacterium]|nr:hypothetical protein [Pasteurellaceae bacterium]